MSPENRKKLNALRKRLDILDNKLLSLISIRSNIVKDVLKLKNHKSEIVDKKRISKILNNIKIKSLKKKIDPKITNRIWKNMIFAYIDYERRNFKKKKLFTMRWKFFFNKNFMFSSSRIIFLCL